MESVMNKTKEKMENAVVTMEKRFTNVRAGRANPNMLDGVTVEYYGTMTPLKQLANIAVPEARQLVVKPYDKGALAAIEKAIFEANLGVTPNNNGEAVFIVIPALNEERRKELVKQVKQIAEEGRIALRNIRQEANNELKKLELSEDEVKRANEQVQKLIDEFNKVVEERLKSKEDELLII
ncbi:MAG: ribosome recycling factor [bacterium]|nr:ribosome recycling factor [bacterium]